MRKRFDIWHLTFGIGLLLLTAHCSLLTGFAQGTPGTVRCPAQTDTLDSLFRVADSARTNLSAAATSGATSITVLSTSLFPSSGSIKIDGEVIYYTSKTATTFEGLVRGASGTTAASHASGTLAQAPILAAHHNTLAAALICAQEKALAAQVADADLTAIAGLSPANDDVMQRKAGSWINRTIAQLKADLAVTKSDVGLGNVDNTSDAAKPISTATQSALDAKVDENATITGATKTKITYDAKGLVTAGADATTADVADSTDKRYVTDAQRVVIQNTSGTNTGDQDLSGKQNVDADLTAIAGLSPANDDVIQRKAGSWINRTIAQLKADLAVTKSDVGLGNVDNTSDAAKPISTATQSALDAKQNLDSDLSAIAGLSPANDDVIQRKADSWINRTIAQLKADLGLGNVENTALSTWAGSVNLTTLGAIGTATPFSINGAASTPAVRLTGSWFSGGSATTTKPQILVEPSSATSTNWSPNGTGIGVNAASGFTGRLFDAQLNGTSYFHVDISTAKTFSNLTIEAVRFRDGAGGGRYQLATDDAVTLSLGSGRLIAWNATDAYNGTKDISLRRGSAGQLDVGDGGANANGALKVARIGLNVTPPGTAGQYSATLGANNITGLLIKRNTDTAPTGKFFDFQNAAGSTVASMDIAGNLTVTGCTGCSGGISSINGDSSSAQTINAADASITVTNSGATHSIALPYTVYVATVTQTGTSAPSATVHTNTAGTTLTFARTTSGTYTVTAGSAIFAANKTTCEFGAMKYSGSSGKSYIASCDRTSTTVLTIYTQYQAGIDGLSNLDDGLLTETKIEIRIYP